MSPFRDAPPIELGPLSVGLEATAARAIARLPRGGRVVAARARGLASHTAGALGSAGLLAFTAGALVVWATRWHPVTAADLVACAAAIAGGGLSLAAVMRAADRAPGPLTRPGDQVGQRARRILRRMARLAEQMASRPSPGRAAALRRAIDEATDPELGRWIPPDVIGRAELLLARSIATLAGPRWDLGPACRYAVASLLRCAAGRLADPAPAEADLAAMDRSPAPRAGGHRFANVSPSLVRELAGDAEELEVSVAPALDRALR